MTLLLFLSERTNPELRELKWVPQRSTAVSWQGSIGWRTVPVTLAGLYPPSLIRENLSHFSILFWYSPRKNKLLMLSVFLINWLQYSQITLTYWHFHSFPFEFTKSKLGHQLSTPMGKKVFTICNICETDPVTGRLLEFSMSLIPHTGCPSDKEPIKDRRTGVKHGCCRCVREASGCFQRQPQYHLVSTEWYQDENQFACLIGEGSGGQRRLGERWPQKPGACGGPGLWVSLLSHVSGRWAQLRASGSQEEGREAGFGVWASSFPGSLPTWGKFVISLHLASPWEALIFLFPHATCQTFPLWGSVPRQYLHVADVFAHLHAVSCISLVPLLSRRDECTCPLSKLSIQLMWMFSLSISQSISFHMRSEFSLLSSQVF